MDKATEQQNNKRIAKNTLLLYFRMLLTMAVGLYTSRVVLQTLGVEDFGIYNVVGGVVSMFGFLNSAMTTSTQRYLTYELGKNDSEKLKQVFATSIQIHFVISLVVILLAETIGLWFLKEKIVVSETREYAAMWVYQLSIITTVVAILSFPYNAVIVAHEKMSAFAYISLVEVLLKLLIVYLLLFSNADRLILYALLLALIQVIIRFIYSIYCSRHFPETKFTFRKDIKLFKEMISFAGWNLWGNLAGILFTQGLNILLNMFFGPVVNAARAISVQVQNAIIQFSSNFQMAINPQITKTYAAGNLAEMHKLIFRSSKFTFFLLFSLCLPIFIECPTILKIWLKNVPVNTVIFLRIMMITMIIDAVANPLMISAAATGHVKKYQSIIGGILLLIVPLSYIVLKLGGAPWSVFLVHLCICCIAFIIRLIIVKPLIKISLTAYFKDVISRCLCVSFFACIFPFVFHCLSTKGWISFLISLIVSFSSACIFSFFGGFDTHERKVIISKVSDLKQKVFSK